MAKRRNLQPFEHESDRLLVPVTGKTFAETLKSFPKAGGKVYGSQNYAEKAGLKLSDLTKGIKLG